MIVGLTGDWHGNTMWARSVLGFFADNGVTTVYQLGDFGVWGGDGGQRYINAITEECRQRGITLWVTPGNHENWEMIDDIEGERQILAGDDDWEVALLPRGYQWEVEGRSFISLGGAPSIDFEGRREGISWWKGEMIRPEHLDRLAPADVMLTHDAADGGTAKVQTIINTPPHLSFWSERALRYAREGRMLMNAAVEIVNPRLFAHGHMHVDDFRYDKESDRRWLSLGSDGEIRNIALLNTESLDIAWVKKDQFYRQRDLTLPW